MNVDSVWVIALFMLVEIVHSFAQGCKMDKQKGKKLLIWTVGSIAIILTIMYVFFYGLGLLELLPEQLRPFVIPVAVSIIFAKPVGYWFTQAGIVNLAESRFANAIEASRYAFGACLGLYLSGTYFSILGERSLPQGSAYLLHLLFWLILIPFFLLHSKRETPILAKQPSLTMLAQLLMGVGMLAFLTELAIEISSFTISFQQFLLMAIGAFLCTFGCLIQVAIILNAPRKVVEHKIMEQNE